MLKMRHAIGDDFVEVEGSAPFCVEMVAWFRAFHQRLLQRQADRDRGERIRSALTTLRREHPALLHKSAR